MFTAVAGRNRIIFSTAATKAEQDVNRHIDEAPGDGKHKQRQAMCRCLPWQLRGKFDFSTQIFFEASVRPLPHIPRVQPCQSSTAAHISGLYTDKIHEQCAKRRRTVTHDETTTGPNAQFLDMEAMNPARISSLA